MLRTYKGIDDLIMQPEKWLTYLEHNTTKGIDVARLAWSHRKIIFWISKQFGG